MTSSPCVPFLGSRIPIMTLQPYPGSPRAGGKKRFVRAKVRVRSLQITSGVGG